MKKENYFIKLSSWHNENGRQVLQLLYYNFISGKAENI